MHLALLACREPYSLQGKPLPNVRASLGDYWRAGSVLLKDSLERKDLVILHIPKERVQHMKAAVLGENCRWLQLYCDGGARLKVPICELNTQSVCAIQ
jgi:hypothetical protein